MEVTNGLWKTWNLGFGQALEMLKVGYKVARAGWNGKGMYLFLAKGTEIEFPKGDSHAEREVLPSIVMKTADDKLVVGWLASQTDMLAEDWMVLK